MHSKTGMRRDTVAHEIRDNSKAHRFEDRTGAFVTYRESGGVVTLLHIEVPLSSSRHGAGEELVKDVLRLLRERGRQVLSECSFVSDYIKAHPEYRAMLADEAANRLDARLDEALRETFPASDPTAVNSRE
jgi:predicted GNAT family acetyltransferase